MRTRHVHARLWQGVAAILLASATIVSIARHDTTTTTQIGVAQNPTHANRGAEIAQSARANGTPASAPDPAKLETRLAYVSGRIETSLFEDGQQAGLSDALILKLIEVFGWDIDFALGVRAGDSFAVVHEEKYWMGQKVADGPILAAKFVNRDEVHQAIGFRDGNGEVVYYEPNGLTKSRRFLRTPIEFSRISSRYTDTASRFHPILKIWTAHRGVDYAAPAGTPIRATAKGRIMPTDTKGKVTSLESNGGYGKAIVVRHEAVTRNEGVYETLYAHMSRYAPNVRVGSFVEQGQIIGYVGQTGLATGPHLHYEFRINGEHRDPLKLKFPSTTMISAAQRNAFVAQTQSLLAQLELITDRHLAANR